MTQPKIPIGPENLEQILMEVLPKFREPEAVELICGEDSPYSCRPTKYDRMREELQEKTGNFYFYKWEIMNLIRHLGGSRDEETIRTNLLNERVRPSDYDVNAHRYRIFDLYIYPAEAVWDYLQRLEGQGVISFEVKKHDGQTKTVESISDLVRLGYHKNLNSLYMYLHRLSEEKNGKK